MSNEDVLPPMPSSRNASDSSSIGEPASPSGQQQPKFLSVQQKVRSKSFDPIVEKKSSDPNRVPWQSSSRRAIQEGSDRSTRSRNRPRRRQSNEPASSKKRRAQSSKKNRAASPSTAASSSEYEVSEDVIEGLTLVKTLLVVWGDGVGGRRRRRSNRYQQYENRYPSSSSPRARDFEPREGRDRDGTLMPGLRDRIEDNRAIKLKPFHKGKPKKGTRSQDTVLDAGADDWHDDEKPNLKNRLRGVGDRLRKFGRSLSVGGDRYENRPYSRSRYVASKMAEYGAVAGLTGLALLAYHSNKMK